MARGDKLFVQGVVALMLSTNVVHAELRDQLAKLSLDGMGNFGGTVAIHDNLTLVSRGGSWGRMNQPVHLFDLSTNQPIRSFSPINPEELDSFGHDVALNSTHTPIDAGAAELPKLQPGDADQDLDFDALDLVQVQMAAKYLTGATASWGEGDWDGAPGGAAGNPAAGDGVFDQRDIVAALSGGMYLSGRYRALAPGGMLNDERASVVYDARTGEIAIDVPESMAITSLNIGSEAAVFTGSPAENLDGSLDRDRDDRIFKAVFASSFGSLSFGPIAKPGLDEDFLLADLSFAASLQGGGLLSDVDLVYIPEPPAAALLGLGSFSFVFCCKRRFPFGVLTPVWRAPFPI